MISFQNIYIFFIFVLVEDAGGKALPCIVDVRDELAVRAAIKSAAEKVFIFAILLFIM